MTQSVKLMGDFGKFTLDESVPSINDLFILKHKDSQTYFCNFVN